MSDFESEVSERVKELIDLVGIESETSRGAELYQSERGVGREGEESVETGRGRGVQIAYNRMFARLGDYHATDAVEALARARAAEDIADQLEEL